MPEDVSTYRDFDGTKNIQRTKNTGDIKFGFKHVPSTPRVLRVAGRGCQPQDTKNAKALAAVLFTLQGLT
jgi:hypothetical protein